jgi:hypothetical protein
MEEQVTTQIENAPMASYALNGGPEIVRFVRMGFTEPMYHVIREDPYGMWPWTNGKGEEIKMKDCVMNKQEVYARFGIMLEI